MFINNYRRTVRGYKAMYKGKGAPSVQTVAATPPPAPPAEEAKMREFTDPALEKDKVKAKTQGARSLQIPLGSLGTTGSIGTV